MANRYWIATAAANWNSTANWSATSGGAGGASVPGIADSALFDGAGAATGACTLDVNVACVSITLSTAFASTLNGATFDVALSGSFTAQSGTTANLGSGTWTVAWSWDWRSATMDAQTSTVVLTGASKTLSTDIGDLFYNLTIASGASIAGAFCRPAVSNDFVLESGASLTAKNVTFYSGITIDGTLTLTGTGSNVLWSGDTISLSGTGEVLLSQADAYLSLFVETAGTVVTIGASTDLAFGEIQYRTVFATNPVFSIDNSAGGSLTFTGDFYQDPASSTLTLSWSKGAGNITFAGSADQLADFAGNAVEDIMINNSGGSVVLASDVDPDSLTIAAGGIDIDGNTLTTIGNVVMSAGTSVADTAATGDFSIGGILDINGTAGTGCTWTDADISALASGSNVAEYCTVSNSTNSSGNAIDASTGSVDDGGNVGWTFSSVTIPLSGYWGVMAAL